MEQVGDAFRTLGAVVGLLSGVILLLRYLEEKRHAKTTALFWEDFMEASEHQDDGLFVGRLHNTGSRRLYLTEAWIYMEGYGRDAGLALPLWIEPGQSVEVRSRLSDTQRHLESALYEFENREATLKDLRSFRAEFVDGEGHVHATRLRGAPKRRLEGTTKTRMERVKLRAAQPQSEEIRVAPARREAESPD